MEEPYLVPEYFPAFSCKMGACRHACCEGWPISVTMKDYFTLLGVDCSPELRRKLDCALHLAPHPTEDAYAQILPRYDGQCPLHLPDGRCALHAECGDGVLAAVCRLYPRGVRNGDDRECSCANSCEAVIELLMHHEPPLRFIRIRRDFGLPDMPRRHFFHTAGREQEIRLWLISHLQRREYPLPRRMLLLGEALHTMDDALLAKDDARVDAILTGREAISVPECPVPGQAELLRGIEIMEHMLSVLDRSSNSIRSYGEEALAYFGSGESAFDRYEAAVSRFMEVVPQWETWFEHLLVNHMFFVQFPFQDRPVPLRDEYLSLCAVYTLLRCLCVGCLADKGDTVRAADIAAAAFRLVDHTEFDRYAAPLLRELGCDDWAHIRLLLSL